MDQNRLQNSAPAICVKNVSKSFRVYSDRALSLKDRLLFWNRNNYTIHDVLDGLSFEVARGEAVGLIGHNGCGKSTTLKMLTRIMYPDSGTITVDGRVSALIELGAGFHPDMSGRENIYTNAAIFGLSRREIDERLEDIIAFSELGGFIDSPVRTYSSGMYMRLAFSVAINVDADILFVDEILAVGDAAFQAKCISKLKKIKAAGTTIVIVSHDLKQIENLCDRSIWIKDGRVAMEGDPETVHAAYLAHMESVHMDPSGTARPGKIATPEVSHKGKERAATITGVTLYNSAGERCEEFERGSEIVVRVDYTAREKLHDPVCGVGFFREDHFYVYGTNTILDNLRTGERIGEQFYVFRIPSNPLMPGVYSIDAALSRIMGEDYHRLMNAAQFTVTATCHDEGNIYLAHSWELSD